MAFGQYFLNSTVSVLTLKEKLGVYLLGKALSLSRKSFLQEVIS